MTACTTCKDMTFNQNPWADIDDTEFIEYELSVSERCEDINYKTLLGLEGVNSESRDCPYCTVLRKVLECIRVRYAQEADPKCWLSGLAYRCVREYGKASSFVELRVLVTANPHWRRYYLLASPNTDTDSCPWDLRIAPRIYGARRLDSAVERIGRWLNDCTSSHRRCHSFGAVDPEESPLLPSRVLDVWHGSGYVKLVETSEGQRDRYICLSHRWGSKSCPEFKTERSTLEAYKQGIEFTRLPKLFAEAVLVVRQLGINYLWIDSLCIVQDDGEDWNRESAKMGSIYRNGYLTIAAARSQHCGDSLFSPASAFETVHGRLGEEKPFSLLLNPYGKSFAPSSVHHPHQETVDDLNPLSSRAWVFQERYLSRRIVYFREHELAWECQKEMCCECGFEESGVPDWEQFVKKEFSYAASSPDFWHKIVRIYTRLDMSHAEDRLKALLGFANEVQKVRTGRYIAGLWEDSLLQDLCWVCRDTAVPVHVERLRDVAPTWSWGSIEGQCSYKFGSELTPKCEVLRIASPSHTPRQQTRELSGCITLRAPVLPFIPRVNPNKHAVLPGVKVLCLESDDSCAFKPDRDYSADERADLYCVHIADFPWWNNDANCNEVALVVKCVDSSRQLYERMGLYYKFSGQNAFNDKDRKFVVHLV
jgi:hypothetical protein